jgi:hypothetical protein
MWQLVQALDIDANHAAGFEEIEEMGVEQRGTATIGPALSELLGRISAIVSWICHRSRTFYPIGWPNQRTVRRLFVLSISTPKKT